MIKKFMSRKFITYIITTTILTVLGIIGKISGTELVIGLIVSSFIYSFVEGVIDVSEVKKVSMKDIVFERFDKEKGGEHDK